MRAGEDVPPPVVAEVTVQTDAGEVCSAPAEASQEAAEIAPDGATTNAETSAPAPRTPPVESEITVQADAAEGREVEAALPNEALPPAPEQSPDAAERKKAAQVAT